MLFPVGIFSATVDDAPLTVPLPIQRLAYSDLVCSATMYYHLLWFLIEVGHKIGHSRRSRLRIGLTLFNSPTC
jgi:hypothetical protein